jgi:tRNA(Ile)-lysidine synthase
MRRLLDARAPRRPVRMGRLSMERSGPWLRVGPCELPVLAARALRVPGTVDLSEVGLRLSARCLDRHSGYTLPREPRRAAFDADRLPAILAVRPRRAGERFRPFGGSDERRLKSLFIDAGIPRWERARVPLLEAAGDVIWVAGVRRGQSAPVGPDTTRILEVTLDSL